MARLKLSFFVLPALVLWPLMMLAASPRLGERAVENATQSARAARLAAEATLSTRRAALASALVSGVSALPGPKGGGSEKLRQLFPAVRVAVKGALPEA